MMGMGSSKGDRGSETSEDLNGNEGMTAPRKAERKGKKKGNDQERFE